MKRLVKLLLSVVVFLSIGVVKVKAIDYFEIEVYGETVFFDADNPEITSYTIGYDLISDDGTEHTYKEFHATVDGALGSHSFSDIVNQCRGTLKEEAAAYDNFVLLVHVTANIGDSVYKYSRRVPAVEFFRLDSEVETLNEYGEGVPYTGGTVSETTYWPASRLADFTVSPYDGYMFEANGGPFSTTSILEKEKFFLKKNVTVKVTFFPYKRVNIDTGFKHADIASSLEEYFEDTPMSDLYNMELNGSVLSMNLPSLMIRDDETRPLTYNVVRINLFDVITSKIITGFDHKGETIFDINNDLNRDTTIDDPCPELDKVIAEGDIFYALWGKNIKKLEFVVDDLAPDTEIKILRDQAGGATGQAPAPKITFKTSNVSILNAPRDIPMSFWVTLDDQGEFDDLFEGIVTNPMYGYVIVKADQGYLFDPYECKVFVDGKEAFKYRVAGNTAMVLFEKNLGAGTYKTTAGDGNVWFKGSGKTSNFTFKRTIDDTATFVKFKDIKVDNKPIHDTDYTKEEGSLIIKLKPECLEKLPLGTHTITANFEDGSVTANFEVRQVLPPDNTLVSVPNTSTK